MFVTQVDLRGNGRAFVEGANGIAALAVDPGSDLDVARFNGAVLRPGGVWLPAKGRLDNQVSVERVRITQGLDLRECSQMLLQVFEPGDVIIPPPKRCSKVYEVPTVALALTTPTFIKAVPFVGRRVLSVSCVGPAGSICTVRVVGRRTDGSSVNHVGIISGTPPPGGDAFTSSAASAEIVGSGVAAKTTGQTRYYGGTDSLEMWDEMHVMANANTAGTYSFVFEISDEVG